MTGDLPLDKELVMALGSELTPAQRLDALHRVLVHGNSFSWSDAQWLYEHCRKLEKVAEAARGYFAAYKGLESFGTAYTLARALFDAGYVD